MLIFTRIRRRSPALVALLLGILFLFSCKPRPEAEWVALEGPFDPYGGAAPALRLPAAPGPRWFEFGPEGPAAVPAPDDAGLVPFAPWPLARRSAGLAVGADGIAIGVNREGFLAVHPAPDGTLALYRIVDVEFAAPYSVAAVFTLDGRPGILLYRDRFFVDPEAPAPDPRVLVLARDSPLPVPADPAAFADLPATAGWDVDALQRGTEGRWYFRASRSDSAESGVRSFLSVSGLDRRAQASSAAEFLAAGEPRRVAAAEKVLRAALLAAEQALGGAAAVVSVVSPEHAGTRSYRLGAGDGERMQRLWAWADDRRALVLLADGTGIHAGTAGAAPAPIRFPPLPAGFFYTGVAVAGDVYLATWEEQDGWAVGAAGFVLLYEKTPP